VHVAVIQRLEQVAAVKRSVGPWSRRSGARSECGCRGAGELQTVDVARLGACGVGGKNRDGRDAALASDVRGGLCSVPVLCFVRKAEEGGNEGDDRWVRLAHLLAMS